MHCANPECGRLVVRGHDGYTKFVGHQPQQQTDTWIVHPRHSSRPLEPIVHEEAEALASDYEEAVAILDVSHRMSAVLARSILADLLAQYAGCTEYGLNDQINTFIADAGRPTEIRELLHYLREIADLSAHTKTNDQLERIPISREEADWTLTIVERLFDYFIVAPAKADKLKTGMDAKLADAGRKPIKPLPLDTNGEEAAAD
jgi:hypothetical protein